MKHRCPNCGHQWEEPSANQQAGGKARWKRTTKKQRSAAAKAAAEARWKTKKATGPQNNGHEPRGGAESMSTRKTARRPKAGQRNGQRGASHVGSGDMVVLLCRKCGAKTKTKRESYEPPEVATVTCLCPKCDNGGGFDDLQYLDAKGRDIGDIYAKHNNELTREAANES